MSDKLRRFGVEIEGYGLNWDEVSEIVNKYTDDVCTSWERMGSNPLNWTVTHDGTIIDGNGHPMPQEFELRSPAFNSEEEGFAKLRAVLPKLREAGAKVNRSCGLHVHHEASYGVKALGGDTTSLQQAAHFLYSCCEKAIDSVLPPSRRGTHPMIRTTLTPDMVRLQKAAPADLAAIRTMILGGEEQEPPRPRLNRQQQNNQWIVAALEAQRYEAEFNRTPAQNERLQILYDVLGGPAYHERLDGYYTQRQELEQELLRMPNTPRIGAGTYIAEYHRLSDALHLPIVAFPFHMSLNQRTTLLDLTIAAQARTLRAPRRQTFHWGMQFEDNHHCKISTHEALRRHFTIEYRQHSGTLMVGKIIPWVRLTGLLHAKAISLALGELLPKPMSLSQMLQYLGAEPTLTNYWMVRRAKVKSLNDEDHLEQEDGVYEGDEDSRYLALTKAGAEGRPEYKSRDGTREQPPQRHDDVRDDMERNVAPLLRREGRPLNIPPVAPVWGNLTATVVFTDVDNTTTAGGR